MKRIGTTFLALAAMMMGTQAKADLVDIRTPAAALLNGADAAPAGVKLVHHGRRGVPRHHGKHVRLGYRGAPYWGPGYGRGGYGVGYGGGFGGYGIGYGVPVYRTNTFYRGGYGYGYPGNYGRPGCNRGVGGGIYIGF